MAAAAAPAVGAAAAMPTPEDLQLKMLGGALLAKDMFLASYTTPVPEDGLAARLRLGTKFSAEYAMLPSASAAEAAASEAKETVSEADGLVKPLARKRRQPDESAAAAAAPEDEEEADELKDSSSGVGTALVEVRAQHQLIQQQQQQKQQQQQQQGDLERLRAIDEKLARVPEQYRATTALILRQRELQAVRPTWHAPWELMRVIAGDLGWVRALAVDPGNEIFFTGSSDGTIKVFDLASGDRLNTLTGHISAIRGLAVCPNLAYLISASEDKSVIVWDLQRNRIVQKFHGHLSGVYCVAVHPTLDNLVVSGGRDSSARIWDVRQPQPVVTLTGHANTVGSVAMQNTQPQLITGSYDSTIRCWDMRKPNGATDILTHHKKAVRALRFHHSENTFVSAAADNLKVWRCPQKAIDDKVSFYRNIAGHNSIVNALALNQDNVLVSGGDDGSLKFWDWSSGHCFQTLQSHVQPGSLDSEAAIFDMGFDMTGSRLITCEGDKTVKIWREDPEATEESHPLDWQPQKRVKMY